MNGLNHLKCIKEIFNRNDIWEIINYYQDMRRSVIYNENEYTKMCDKIIELFLLNEPVSKNQIYALKKHILTKTQELYE